ncbi:MAG TPA: hypothetical protein VKA68_12835 [bacterium]|nr:hypothetical protein [bacterium]
MKKGIGVAVLAILVSVFLMTCAAGKLSVDNAYAEPQPVSPGNELSLYVVLNGPSQNVDRVETTVREYTDFRGQLQNNGEGADKATGDNIWSSSFEIPWDAPSGTYHIDVSVYDKDGNELVTEELANQWTGKSATIEVKIQ